MTMETMTNISIYRGYVICTLDEPGHWGAHKPYEDRLVVHGFSFDEIRAAIDELGENGPEQSH